MAYVPNTITEADIFADVVHLGQHPLSAELAKSIVDWNFSDQATARMTELADRNNQGLLNELESEELQKYLRVGSFLNILQSKARLSLGESDS